MTRVPVEIVGIGSPIMDFIADVAEEELAALGSAKGGMTLVSSDAFSSIVQRLRHQPQVMPGGSAANTVFALTRLGMPCSILGKLGMDAHGTRYRSAFELAGGDPSRFKYDDEAATACCLSLVTPDSERTMHTDLGASSHLAPADIIHDDFAGVRHAHVEGYLLFNPDLLLSVCRTAKAAGCRVSLDLGAFQVVEAMRDLLPSLLAEYVDIVFANEDEAAAFCGTRDPLVGLQALGTHCETAVVKIGADGAWIQQESTRCHVPAHPVEQVIDTTGAGDLWAAGFLYGHLNGYPLDTCGRLGALISSHVVQYAGAGLPESVWDALRTAVRETVAP